MQDSTVPAPSVATLPDSAGFRSVKPGRAAQKGHGSEAPGAAPHLLLGVTREAAEKFWEIFSVGTVIHGGVDLVE